VQRNATRIVRFRFEVIAGKKVADVYRGLYAFDVTKQQIFLRLIRRRQDAVAAAFLYTWLLRFPLGKMGSYSRLKRAMRGGVSPRVLALETFRRSRVARHRIAERRDLDALGVMPARLSLAFAALAPDELLDHLRERTTPSSPLDRPYEADHDALITGADLIVNESKWELAGFGQLTFSGQDMWRRDPLSNAVWGLEYHADVEVYRPGGPDIRVLWELNRMGHAVTLAWAYDIAKDEAYAESFFSHLETWIAQNPYGRGANWNCAMEVALRAINLLAAFDIFRRSNACTANRLTLILQLFDQHGRFILDNNEFSYLVTSNHYLSDVIGLFWIGIMLPELEHSSEWREFGLREMLREMDKQILPDGGHFEASTGYHKFVTEMLLCSFLLAKNNGIEIPQKYWNKLSAMLEYVRAILRPDGRAPLIGDADGSQIVPAVKRDADDMAYLLGLGAIVFDETDIKTAAMESVAFPDAGSYVMRDGDLYLHFNANDSGIHGRGSHGHNDALSIEVSPFQRAFIIDPGSHVYNLDRGSRHLFRSTAYHSSVMIDGVEQNTTDADLPFVIGNEAAPTVVEWQTSAARDVIVAEHYGYQRLTEPVVHRRSVDFQKTERFWLVTDTFSGTGNHKFTLSFHIAPGLLLDEIDSATVRLYDTENRQLLIKAVGIDARPAIEPAACSRNYGHKEPSQILVWNVTAAVPFEVRFLLLPVAADETLQARLALAGDLTQNIGN
jgi:hypothetical protein